MPIDPSASNNNAHTTHQTATETGQRTKLDGLHPDALGNVFSYFQGGDNAADERTLARLSCVSHGMRDAMEHNNVLNFRRERYEIFSGQHDGHLHTRQDQFAENPNEPIATAAIARLILNIDAGQYDRVIHTGKAIFSESTNPKIRATAIKRITENIHAGKYDKNIHKAHNIFRAIDNNDIKRAAANRIAQLIKDGKCDTLFVEIDALLSQYPNEAVKDALAARRAQTFL